MRGRRQNFSDEQILKAIARHDEGFTWRWAAAELGISESRLLIRANELRGRPYPSSVRVSRYRLISGYEYDKRYAEQEGKCAICQKPSKRLVTDHRSNPFKIRGLLCRSCNAALGWLEKGNGTWLKTALGYLRKHRPRTIAGLASAAAQGRRGGARPQYAETDIERASAAFHAGTSYKDVAKTVLRRDGRAITLTQLKRRIDEHERRKAV
jgi:hypothetical protein